MEEDLRPWYLLRRHANSLALSIRFCRSLLEARHDQDGEIKELWKLPTQRRHWPFPTFMLCFCICLRLKLEAMELRVFARNVQTTLLEQNSFRRHEHESCACQGEVSKRNFDQPRASRSKTNSRQATHEDQVSVTHRSAGRPVRERDGSRRHEGSATMTDAWELPSVVT